MYHLLINFAGEASLFLCEPGYCFLNNVHGWHFSEHTSDERPQKIARSNFHIGNGQSRLNFVYRFCHLRYILEHVFRTQKLIFRRCHFTRKLTPLWYLPLYMCLQSNSFSYQHKIAAELVEVTLSEIIIFLFTSLSGIYLLFAADRIDVFHSQAHKKFGVFCALAYATLR